MGVGLLSDVAAGNDSSFSEEKEAKKRRCAHSSRPPTINGQKFFGSFFQKRTAFFFAQVSGG
jgi:hypothetical protein